MNRKAEILYRLKEPLAAGMFEDENASIVERYGRGLRRYFENAAPPPENGLLYPAPEDSLWGLAGKFVRFDYSYSFSINADGLRELGGEALADPFEKRLLDRAVDELCFWRSNLIPQRYTVGGGGFTHSILNYRRILKEGLGGYRKRVDAMKKSPLRAALRDTLAGIEGFLDRTPGTIRRDVTAGARDFHSAMRSFNFFFALDGYDSAGRFDDYMGEYYRGEEDAQIYVEELFRAVDLHNGWHFIHTARYPEFTRICLRAQKLRRPNSGLLAGSATPSEIWDDVFDLWEQGLPSPSLYNTALYRAAVDRRTDAKGKDRNAFAYAGCSELMLEGLSNTGSVEAGLNLLEILATGSPATFRADIRRHLEEVENAVRLNTEFAAQFRPQLIRTLFIDDCIEREVEFNAGGARYSGSVINVAGLTDAANSLAASAGVGGKFGNDEPGVDDIAASLARFVFTAINRLKGRFGGRCLPGVILFTTYTTLGGYVGATPDGREEGAPLASSVGAADGTDSEGPTALINSVVKLPLHLCAGTPILNVRLRRSLAGKALRAKLKALIMSYFEQGGMQFQPTLIDRRMLEEAYLNPGAHPSLIIRIGGYSEYYHRLSRELQLEVLKRTEH